MGVCHFVEQGSVTFTDYKAFLLLKKKRLGKKSFKGLISLFLSSRSHSPACIKWNALKPGWASQNIFFQSCFLRLSKKSDCRTVPSRARCSHTHHLCWVLLREEAQPVPAEGLTATCATKHLALHPQQHLAMALGMCEAS